MSIYLLNVFSYMPEQIHDYLHKLNGNYYYVSKNMKSAN